MRLVLGKDARAKRVDDGALVVFGGEVHDLLELGTAMLASMRRSMAILFLSIN
jgi:hypothetical protein